MSFWLTKGTTEEKDYIIIKHTIPRVNYTIQGVKFRNSYAVVEKNSKVYFSLKKLPVLKNAKEYPLVSLRNLPFITRNQDVLTVYGRDVYNKYLKVLEEELAKENEELKAEEYEKHIETGHCAFIKSNGDCCRDISLPFAQYCVKHILEDSVLEKLGIPKPRFMDKDERKAFRKRVYSILQQKNN